MDFTTRDSLKMSFQDDNILSEYIYRHYTSLLTLAQVYEFLPEVLLYDFCYIYIHL